MPLPLRLLLSLLLLLPLVAPAVAGAQDDSVLLRLNLQPDETYRVAMVMDQEIVQPPGGPMNTLKQRMGMGMLVKVDDVDGEKISSTVSYEWVEVRQHGMGLNTAYDSRRTPGMPQDPAAMGYAVLVGKSFKMSMSPDGDVTDVTGVDRMVEEIIRDMAVPPELQVQVRRDLRESLSDDTFRQQFAVATFPTEPLRVGDTWEQEQRSGGQHPMVVSSHFTLEAIEEGIARIAVRSTLSSPEEMDADAQTTELEGKQNGWIWINISTGWIERGRMEQTVKTMVQIMPGQQMPLEMTGDIRMWAGETEPEWGEEE